MICWPNKLDRTGDDRGMRGGSWGAKFYLAKNQKLAAKSRKSRKKEGSFLRILSLFAAILRRFPRIIYLEEAIFGSILASSR
jgi:hypothetical protein